MDLPAAVVFDVDGTLVSSEREGHRVAFNAAFAELGLDDRWGEDHYGELLAVAGGRRRLEHYLRERGRGPDEAAELAARLHEIKTERFRRMATAGEIPARPGAGRLLDEVAAAGVTVAVATTGSRAWVEPLLEYLFGLERFAAVLTGDDVERRKPDPEVYEQVLDVLGVSAGETVAVEDAAKGVAAAEAVGIPCLVVVNDYTRHEFTGDGGSDAALVVDRFGRPGRASVIRGPADALENGAVTLATLARLVTRP